MISVINITNWTKNNIDTNKVINNVQDDINVTEIEDDENTELINEEEDKNSDYWYYVNFPLIDVDVNKLKEKNQYTVGWINVNNTNINYPYVLYTDNEYQQFLNTIKERSIYSFNSTLTTTDKILTLSTCYSDTVRTVVHAKLIKKSIK